MPTDLLYPEDIDALVNWHPGTAARLAGRGQLPHYVLPDGSIRFRAAEVAPLIRHVPAKDIADRKVVSVARQPPPAIEAGR